jgi:phage terminase small subunit
MNMYNAAIEAGYSPHYARKASARLERQMPTIIDYFDRVGLTDKKIAEVLGDAVVAEKVIGYLHQYKKGDKGAIEKIKPDETISNEFVEVPDWQARLKALELLSKIKKLITNNTNIDQSKHFTKVVYEWDDGRESKDRKDTLPASRLPVAIPGSSG